MCSSLLGIERASHRAVELSMAFVGGSWGVSCALLAVNSALSLITAAIAGWAFNKNMDQALSDVVVGGKLILRCLLSMKEASLDQRLNF